MTTLAVSKSALKAKMLEYFRQVEERGDELVVTSHGHPVAKVIPFVEGASVEEVFGDVRGKLVYRGEIMEPEEEEWEALK